MDPAPDPDSGYSKWLTITFPGSTLNGSPPYDTTYIGTVKWHTPLYGLIIGGFAM
ncbi:MAG: hypothetical protein KJP07_05285 [Desulfatitalea sp.]|nr:hypothetical protein [Desulfatitalea sp.]